MMNYMQLTINHIYMGRLGCVCMCVSRMDGQTACLMLTKISEWIAIYLGGNIGGLKFTPHLSKWSPPREVDLKNLPDETFGRPLLSNISGAT